MKKGFTAIELMVGMLVFALVVTSLWQIYVSSHKSARTIIETHSINEEVDRTLLKIMDDIRESNYFYDNCPPSIEPSMISNLETSRDNYMMFMKVLYDFSKDPSELPDGEVNYTQNKVEYYVERSDINDNNSDWILYRRMVPYDSRRQPVDSQETIFEILRGIKECNFYRIKDPDASRSGNIYIRLKLSRDAHSGIGEHANDITVSVKERGASPE